MAFGNDGQHTHRRAQRAPAQRSSHLHRRTPLKTAPCTCAKFRLQYVHVGLADDDSTLHSNADAPHVQRAKRKGSRLAALHVCEPQRLALPEPQLYLLLLHPYAGSPHDDAMLQCGFQVLMKTIYGMLHHSPALTNRQCGTVGTHCLTPGLQSAHRCLGARTPAVSAVPGGRPAAHPPAAPQSHRRRAVSG